MRVGWDASLREGVDAIQGRIGVDESRDKAKRQKREETSSEGHGRLEEVLGKTRGARLDAR